MSNQFVFKKIVVTDNLAQQVSDQADNGFVPIEWQWGETTTAILFRLASPSEQVRFGNTYRVHGSFLSIGNGTSVYIRLKTGAKRIYLTSVNIAPSDELFELNLYEAPTFNGGDNEVSSHNADRNSANIATMQIFDNPTNVQDGTIVEHIFMSGSSGVGQDRNSERYTADVEWVLKPNTEYIYEILNGGSGNADAAWDFSWFEVIHE